MWYDMQKKKGARKMEQEQQKKSALSNQTEPEETINQWRKVPGDIDDFIFSMQEQRISER